MICCEHGCTGAAETRRSSDIDGDDARQGSVVEAGRAHASPIAAEMIERGDLIVAPGAAVVDKLIASLFRSHTSPVAAEMIEPGDLIVAPGAAVVDKLIASLFRSTRLLYLLFYARPGPYVFVT